MTDKVKSEPKTKRLFDPTEIRADYLSRLLTGDSIVDYTPPEFIDKSGASHGLNPNPDLNHMTFDEREKTMRKRARIERNYEHYMEKSGNAKAEKVFHGIV